MATVDADVALTTLAEAKSFLKIASGVSSEDSIVSELINAAGEFANRYTSRHLIKKTYTEFYDGVAPHSLIVRNYPVVSVAHLYDDLTQVFGSDTEIAASDFAIDKDSGIIRLAYGAVPLSTGRGNIKVVYDAGYDASAIPAGLKEAAHISIGSWYKNFYEFQRGGVQTSTQGDRTVQTRDEDVPKAVKTILDTYKAIGQTTSFSHD